MTIRTTCAAAAIALAATDMAANAATYEFTSGTASDLGPSHVFSVVGGPALTAWAGSDGVLNDGLATLTQNGNGLGVNGRFDLNPWQLDGFPLFSSEFITFTFAHAIRLVSVGFLNVDRNDQFDYSINGGDFVNSVTIGARTTTYTFDLDSVTSLVIRASGTPLVDAGGNDDFTVARIQVAPIPLPAGGVLLLGALGGLSVLRRRKSS